MICLSNKFLTKNIIRMSYVKYTPGRLAVQSVNNLFDELLNDNFFNNQKTTKESNFVPHVDVFETDKVFELQFSIPGLKKEDLNIELDNSVLTVSGERKFKGEKNEKEYHTLETKYGSFKRSFQLPDSINEDAVEATYEDGILNIQVPKDDKKVEKKKVNIK